MTCPVCKQPGMQEVAEASPLNTTYKCLNCGAQVMQAKKDAADDDTHDYLAVFVRQPDGSMQEVNLSDQ